MTKVCKKCNIEKDITYFFNDKSKKGSQDLVVKIIKLK